MINDFYASLILHKPKQKVDVWDDYVDADFKFSSTPDRSLNNLQSVIVGDSACAEGLAWRMLHIAQLIKNSDLNNLLIYFDRREGFSKELIISNLAKYFRPTISGDLVTEPVAISGKAVSKTYKLLRYVLTSNGTDLKLTKVGSSEEENYLWGSQSYVNVNLFGTSGLVVVPRFTGTSFIDWAARPSYTFTKASENLSKNGALIDTVASLPSVFEADILSKLTRLATDNREPVAQVLAASLLLAGAAIKYV
jgi:hypothetical protein